jgi:hypothetical protein
MSSNDCVFIVFIVFVAVIIASSLNRKTIEIKNTPPPVSNKTYVREIDIVKTLDTAVDRDSLVPPQRRMPTSGNDYLYEQAIMRGQVQIPTRGIPDSYQYLGNLHQKLGNKFIKLYGRRRYDQIWDYYGMFRDENGMMIKTEITTRNNTQIMNQDMVTVDMFGTSDSDKFQAILHRREDFPYLPYIY